MGRESETLQKLDRMLRAIPGARAERRTALAVFEREIAWLIDAHRARSPAAASLIRHAGWTLGQPDPSDADILDASLDDEHARQHVAANGIELTRQWQSPKNAVEIACILITAGSEVDATCDAYGGSTAMGLLVSSCHPAEAGVQVALVETLLDGGAAIDGVATDQGTPIETALAFGYPDAAEALARRGARVDDVFVAAGLGRVELIERLARQPGARLDQAFRIASMLGRTQAALAVLDKGADPTKQDHEGFTGLHWAAFLGHLDTVEALLDRASVRAVLEVKNIYGGTVLDSTVWGARNVKRHVDRSPVIRKLIAAGASIERVRPRPVDVPAIEALLVSANPLSSATVTRDPDVDRVINALREGKSAQVGGGRSFSTYVIRDGQPVMITSDDGVTEDVPISEERLREVVAADRALFLDYLRLWQR